MFDYCDISPAIALVVSPPSKMQVYCGLMNCATRHLLFQISIAKSLSCTDYEIITKTIIPWETSQQLQL
jgi:hypothetical protein